jgi:hypothetical protein
MNKDDKKIVIYIVVGLIVLVIMWQVFKLTSSLITTGKDIEDVEIEKAKAESIAKAAGTTVSKVDQFFGLAKFLAIEMDTYKEDPFGGWTDWGDMQTMWNDQVNSTTDAGIVKSLYKNEMTKSRDLVTDIKSKDNYGVWSVELAKFNFLA